MRSKNPELMQRILRFSEEFYISEGRSPSTSEIGRSLCIGRATAYRYLIAMNANGMLEYERGTIKTALTQKVSGGMTTAASVSSSVSCGLPELAEANIEEYVSLPTAIFGTGELFIVKANGSSMIGADIFDGDLVVVRKQETANEGDIIVALVEGENTLKRLFYDKEMQKIVLHPENSDFKDIVVDKCSIQGVAQHIIKTVGRTGSAIPAQGVR